MPCLILDVWILLMDLKHRIWEKQTREVYLTAYIEIILYLVLRYGLAMLPGLKRSISRVLWNTGVEQ